MKTAAKPYEIRGMVEVDRTVTLFFAAGSWLATRWDGKAPAEPLSRCVYLLRGSAGASPSRSSRTWSNFGTIFLLRGRLNGLQLSWIRPNC